MWSVKAHDLSKHVIGQYNLSKQRHMVCQTMQLVNVNYQNKSTWPVRMCDWSKQKIINLSKQKKHEQCFKYVDTI